MAAPETYEDVMTLVDWATSWAAETTDDDAFYGRDLDPRDR